MDVCLSVCLVSRRLGSCMHGCMYARVYVCMRVCDGWCRQILVERGIFFGKTRYMLIVMCKGPCMLISYRNPAEPPVILP